MAEEIAARLDTALAGRYVVEREVGRGGMARVFLATDVRHERRVAIKVLHPELAASIGSERFLREIRLAATLQHPHILGLYDSGDADGLFFYVMPFVEGESLRDRLDREKQLPIDDALQIARESASALDFAHRQGVVHRDIKPENILLVDGHAIVADFGIARAVSVAGAEKLTETGMAVGTPLYMSPEQASGEPNIDGRSDIYALGCVLYEMLVGEPPFRGPNAMAILARHTLESVPSLQIVRNTVPDEVEDAVMRALAKAPADRFATAGQLEKALLMSTTTVTNRATERALRAQTATMRVKQRRLGVISGGVASAAIVFGVLAFNRVRDRPTVTPADGLDFSRLAVLPFDDRSPDKALAFLADGLTRALTERLSRVAALDVKTPSAVRAFRADSIAPDSAARALNVGTLVTGSVVPIGRDTVGVDIALLDASGAPFPKGTARIRAARKDLLVLRDSVAREVALIIQQRIGRAVQLREDGRGTANPDAWALVQRARQSRQHAQETARGGDSAVVTRALTLADSLAGQAESLDPSWAEPVTLRGWIAYDQSRRWGTNAALAAPWIDKGLPIADSAVTMQESADALELRGTLTYWKFLLGLGATKDEPDRLVNAAQKDLERAHALDPTRAGALGTLAHLYARVNRTTDALIAAKQAYDADAYVANADVILYRLFTLSWDLAQHTDAERWCGEGHRRFPSDYRFYDCQIRVMASGTRQPNIDEAWSLVRDVERTVPPGLKPFWTRASQMWTAAAIAQAAKGSAARAVLADSARHVAERARGDATIDPRRSLAQWEAFVDVILGDKDAAVDRLKLWYAANPGASLKMDPSARGSSEITWMFRDLQTDPRVRGIVDGTR